MSFAFFTVDTNRTNALDDIRNAVGTFGYRATVTSPTEWAADSGTVQLITTLRTGLILGGSIIVLVALLALLVICGHHRRNREHMPQEPRIRIVLSRGRPARIG